MAIEQAIAAARAQSYQVVIHAYCDSDCPVREVEVYVKDHDDELVARVAEGGVRCPLCGRRLISHDVKTGEEERLQQEYDARCSVNAQRYIRDHGECVPLEVYGDDRL